jgi:hypothetical protein
MAEMRKTKNGAAIRFAVCVVHCEFQLTEIMNKAVEVAALTMKYHTQARLSGVSPTLVTYSVR